MNERPRVLLAGDFPERPPMTVGGIQAVTWQLASGLAESGDFEVHTAACERFWRAPPARAWRSQWGGCTAHYRRAPRRIPHVVSSWTSDAAYVQHKIRATGAQLVHAHGQVGYTIGALRSGVPHVVTPHGMLAREKRAPEGSGALSGAHLRQALWGATEDWCLAHARHVVAISPYVRRLIEPRTRGHLHEIPNPVDPAFFALERPRRRPPSAAEMSVDAARIFSPDGSDSTAFISPPGGSDSTALHAPILLSVGWLNERKRHELIIRALPLVRERVPGACLRIVGNVEAGEERQLMRLQRLVHELGLGGQVDFLHGLSHEQLLVEYERAGVYVHSAEEESSPVAVAQAMAAGLALCAVDIPGLHHLLVDGQTGVYACEASPRALAAAVVEVLANPILERSLSESARREARARFHPSVVATRTGELYREVLAQSSR